ncbi:MAG: hypothetical protein R2880_02400 [Deinococcales bacterium]
MMLACKLRQGGILGDVAPTVLKLFALNQPSEDDRSVPHHQNEAKKIRTILSAPQQHAIVLRRLGV